MVGIGIIIFLLWGLLFPVTDWCARLLSPKTIKKGSTTGTEICLTFDDGPDPRYTPEVLKILKKHHIPAVFFLVGAKAERFPELVRKIEAEGHQIGCHTYDHRHAYLLSPWKSIATIVKGQQTIERITGKPIELFRPPWGGLNLFQYLFLRYSGLKIILWSANGRDWKKKTGVMGIIERLSQKVKSNTIIVLHDSGGEPGAPDNTVAALPVIISKLGKRHSFVALKTGSGRK